jgi:hypothetical protein
MDGEGWFIEDDARIFFQKKLFELLTVFKVCSFNNNFHLYAVNILQPSALMLRIGILLKYLFGKR